MAILADRTELTTPADGDLYVTTDVSDIADAATGTDKKITWANIKAGLKTYFDTLYPSGSGTSTGSNTGDQTITLTSDVTGSGTGSFATTIANGAVSLAKMANVATGTLFYRKTAGAGAPEVQTLATLKTDLGLTGTNSGDQTTIAGITGTKAQFDTAVTDGNFLYVGDVTSNATHTGEVTGSGALTVDKTAITGKTTVTAVGADYVLISDTSDAGNLKKALASDLIGAGGAVEGTAVLSTGEVGGVKYLREDGDGTCSWQVPAGSGNVSKVGTPADNQIGVWTGDGTIEGDAGLTYNTTTDHLRVTGAPNYADVDNYLATFESTDAGANGAYIALYHNTASPLANDGIGGFDVFGKDSAANVQKYAQFNVDLVDPTSTTEDSKMRFDVMFAGTLRTELTVGDGVIGVSVGDGNNAGVVESNGNQDLILQTGNATTGNITIVDGANGNVQVNPNGTGALAVSTTIELGHATDTTLSRVSAGVVAVEGVTVPTISSTNTLTNKRVTKRIGSTTSSATPTINTDNYDVYRLTAQTTDITSFTTNLSGTPTHDDNLIIEITGTAARAITWGASFEASTVALPTTTVTTAMLKVGFQYNDVTSKWRCIAVA